MIVGHSLVIYAVLASVFALSSLSIHTARRRSRELKRVADALGFRFHSVATPFEGQDIDGISILQDGAKTEVENLIEHSDRGTMLVFDALEPAESFDVVTTVAGFRSDDAALPCLRVMPKAMLRRMQEVLGKHNMHLKCDPEFEHDFLIESDRQREACIFLNHDRVAAISRDAAHLTIETSPHWVFVIDTRANCRVKNSARSLPLPRKSRVPC